MNNGDNLGEGFGVWALNPEGYDIPPVDASMKALRAPEIL